jgi:hypothetical protein
MFMRPFLICGWFYLLCFFFYYFKFFSFNCPCGFASTFDDTRAEFFGDLNGGRLGLLSATPGMLKTLQPVYVTFTLATVPGFPPTSSPLSDSRPQTIARPAAGTISCLGTNPSSWLEALSERIPALAASGLY